MDLKLDKIPMMFESGLYVVMKEDYCTTSFNLGERTYCEGKAYRVDSQMLEEITRCGAGFRLTEQNCPRNIETGVLNKPPTYVVHRPQVSVVPNVTRWSSADGTDTHYLTAGKVTSVPSNLAAWLINHNYAVAA